MIEFFYIIFWLCICAMIVICVSLTEARRDKYRGVASKQSGPMDTHSKGDRRLGAARTSRSKK